MVELNLCEFLSCGNSEMVDKADISLVQCLPFWTVQTYLCAQFCVKHFLHIPTVAEFLSQLLHLSQSLRMSVSSTLPVDS